MQEESVCRACGFPGLEILPPVGGYQYVCCSRCGFVFCPHLTGAMMARMYADGWHGPGDGAPTYGWCKASFLKLLRRLLRRETACDVLDYGAGQSDISEKLRRDGYRVVAVDIAPPLRPHPDRLTGSLRELRLPSDRFDLIYSYEVFEHLPEPVPEFRELMRLLRRGGMLLIHSEMETPERAMGFQHWDYVTPPDHCSFYRHRTFDVLVEDTPHEVCHRSPRMIGIRKGARSY